MITGTHINTALFIAPPVFLPETPDFVERERERERELVRQRGGRGIGDKGTKRMGEGTKDEGRVVKSIFHFQNILHILSGFSGKCRCLG